MHVRVCLRIHGLNLACHQPTDDLSLIVPNDKNEDDVISIARLLMLGKGRTNRLERRPQGLKVETQQSGINEPRRTLFTNEGCDSTPRHTPQP